MCIFFATNYLVKKLGVSDFKKKNLIVMILGFMAYGLLYLLLNSMHKNKRLKKRGLRIVILVLLIIDLIPIGLTVYKDEKSSKKKSVSQKSINKSDSESVKSVNTSRSKIMSSLDDKSSNSQIKPNLVDNNKLSNINQEDSKLEVLQLTDFSTTKGTTNINTALGDAFNTKGESNSGKIELNDKVEDPSLGSLKVTSQISKPQETLPKKNDLNRLDSDNVLSIDEVLKVDEVLEQTNYATTRSKKRSQMPKLIDTEAIDKIKCQDDVPDLTSFTTTSNFNTV